jgi:hypothetical protein
MNIMACGEAEDGRPPTTHDKRVEGNEEDQRFFPPSASARRGEREYLIEAHDNLAYSNHPDINVYRLEACLSLVPFVSEYYI